MKWLAIPAVKMPRTETPRLRTTSSVSVAGTLWKPASRREEKRDRHCGKRGGGINHYSKGSHYADFY